MRIFSPALLITIASLWVCNAQAAPEASLSETSSPVAGLTGATGATGLAELAEVSDTSFLTQVDQVRQSVTGRASELVVDAMGLIGVPYQRGGSTVNSGFDCSGFVRSVYQQSIGLLLPRKAEEQASATHHIAKSELKPGDLVFFNTMRRTFSHVGIYVGGGKFVHSPRPGGEVRVDNMSQSYWLQRFDGARRVLTDASTQAAAPLSLLASTAESVATSQAATTTTRQAAHANKHEAKGHKGRKHAAAQAKKSAHAHNTHVKKRTRR